MGASANTILIIGLVWPEPHTTAAGNRMLQLVDFFRGHRYNTTFVSASSKTEHSYALETLGVQCQKIELNNSNFNAFVAKLNPGIVLFDRFLTEEQFGWRVAEAAPGALRILDTEDLHSLRQVREALFKRNTPFSPAKWLSSAITKREMASIYRCDLSLIISSFEMELLSKTLKMDENLLLHLPFQLDNIDQGKMDSWTPFNSRKDFMCVGNGRHAPNVDAMLWLEKEIWPLIRKSLPTTNIHIYGSYLPKQIKQKHKPKNGFYIEGWVEHIDEAFGSSRINLAPLRFGAGIKGKLVNAMQCGTPSVTTSIGAEGMHGTLPWNGSIVEDPKRFAAAAVALYTDETQWQQAQLNGTRIINELYDKVVLGKSLWGKIQHISHDLINHRTQNFIGAMLMHHSLASTKFLSKWIEEKNREI
ncbi:MAG: glycosyltransferase family 4 protein [Maribacter sp.]|nr:glycosyltransferase family 4 protein [Maribacter sp.]